VTTPNVPTATGGIVIRRAELEDREIVLESVWELAKALAMAAHWSRTDLYPYVSTDGAGGTLQAKAIFLACVNSSAGGPAADGHDHRISPMDGLVGFAAFSTVIAVGAGESTLENMAVALPWQRQGIGRRLLAAGLLWCRAHASGAVFLEVRKSNGAAIALYERAGFSAVGNRPGYYREPVEDGLQMQKFLAQ